MRKKVFFLFISLFFVLSTYAQIEVEEPKSGNGNSTTEGLFVKNGQLKIETIECYDFDDLIVSFDIRKEHYTYDRITVVLTLDNPEDIWKPVEFFYRVSKDDFYKLFDGKEYAYFKIFASSDLNEESLFKNYKKEPLTRAKLQYSKAKKGLNSTKMTVDIKCGKITGSKTIHETKTDGTIVSRDVDIWDWATSSSFDVILKNRIKMPVKYTMQNTFPEVSTTEGGCYK